MLRDSRNTKVVPKILLLVLLLGSASVAEAFVCQPLVLGFHGAKAKKSKWLTEQVVQSINSNYKTYVVGNSQRDELNAQRRTVNFRKSCPNSRVAFIGHSHGGHAAFNAARSLEKDGSSIDVLVTLDPVSVNSWFPHRFKVTEWINVYPDRSTSRIDGAIRGTILGCASGGILEGIVTAICGGVPCGFGSLFSYGCAGGSTAGFWTGRSDSVCELAAHIGLYWGHEDGAFNKPVRNVGHCDTMKLFNSVRNRVSAILKA